MFKSSFPLPLQPLFLPSPLPFSLPPPFSLSSFLSCPSSPSPFLHLHVCPILLSLLTSLPFFPHHTSPSLLSFPSLFLPLSLSSPSYIPLSPFFPLSLFFPCSISRPSLTHLISMFLNVTKSQCSIFSTSTTPQGYIRPRTFLLLTSTIAFDPTTAKGMVSCIKQHTARISYHTQRGKSTQFYLKHTCSIHSSKRKNSTTCLHLNVDWSYLHQGIQGSLLPFPPSLEKQVKRNTSADG